MQPFSFFFFYSLWAVGGDFGSGSGSKFNCAARVGSGQTISGTGRVQASVLSPCRPLTQYTLFITELLLNAFKNKTFIIYISLLVIPCII